MYVHKYIHVYMIKMSSDTDSYNNRTEYTTGNYLNVSKIQMNIRLPVHIFVYMSYSYVI